jgi:channel protein (hemolysin III family)
METTVILGFEDPVDSWSHLMGAIAVCFLFFKLFKKEGIGRTNPIPIIIYSVSCVFLLSMSGVYHLLPEETTARYVLRILDHAGIFLLIAGTLISFHTVLFSGFMKWGIIILASLIAILGITFGSIYFDKLPTYVTHTVFLSFGWLGLMSVIAILRLKLSIPIKYLIYGGLVYTIGAVIDMIQFPILIEGVLGAHQLFHLSVLLGVTFHWIFLIKSIEIVNASRVSATS